MDPMGIMSVVHIFTCDDHELIFWTNDFTSLLTDLNRLHNSLDCGSAPTCSSGCTVYSLYVPGTQMTHDPCFDWKTGLFRGRGQGFKNRGQTHRFQDLILAKLSWGTTFPKATWEAMR